MVSLVSDFLVGRRSMYLLSSYETAPLASGGRKRPALCDHQSGPVLVSHLPDGYQAQCLACGTLGSVRETSKAAWSSLLGEGGNAK
jgi:hypothetical protein